MNEHHGITHIVQGYDPKIYQFIQESWNLFTRFQNAGNADIKFGIYKKDSHSGYYSLAIVFIA